MMTTQEIADKACIRRQNVHARATRKGIKPQQKGGVCLWTDAQARKLMSKPARGRPRKKGAGK